MKINTGELIKNIRTERLKDYKKASGSAMVRAGNPLAAIICQRMHLKRVIQTNLPFAARMLTFGLYFTRCACSTSAPS